MDQAPDPLPVFHLGCEQSPKVLILVYGQCNEIFMLGLEVVNKCLEELFDWISLHGSICSSLPGIGTSVTLCHSHSSDNEELGDRHDSPRCVLLFFASPFSDLLHKCTHTHTNPVLGSTAFSLSDYWPLKDTKDTC